MASRDSPHPEEVRQRRLEGRYMLIQFTASYRVFSTISWIFAIVAGRFSVQPASS
jgi:hypothetical protein